MTGHEKEYYLKRIMELSVERDEAFAQCEFWKEKYLEKTAFTDTSSGIRKWVSFSKGRGPSDTSTFSRIISSLRFALSGARDAYVRMLLEEDEEDTDREALSVKLREVEQENILLREKLKELSRRENESEEKAARLEYLLKQGARDYERLQHELEKVRGRVSESRRQLSVVTGEEEELHSRIVALEEELQGTRLKNNERILELRKNLESKEVMLDNVSDEVERLQHELLEAVTQRDVLNEELEKTRMQLLTLKEEREELERANTVLSEMLNLLEENVAQLEQVMEQQSSEAHTLSEAVLHELTEFLDLFAELPARVNEARNTAGHYMVLYGPQDMKKALDELSHLLDSRQKRIDDLSDALETAEQEMLDLRARLDSTAEDDDLVEQVSRLQSELERYRKAASRSMEDTSRMESLIRRKDSELRELRANLESMAVALQELEDRATELSRERDDLMAQLEEHQTESPNMEHIAALADGLSHMEEELIELEDTVALEVERIGRIPGELDILAQGIENMVPINPERLREMESELFARRAENEKLNIRVGKLEGELLVLRARLSGLGSVRALLEDVMRNLELLGMMKAAADIRAAMEKLEH